MKLSGLVVGTEQEQRVKNDVVPKQNSSAPKGHLPKHARHPLTASTVPLNVKLTAASCPVRYLVRTLLVVNEYVRMHTCTPQGRIRRMPGEWYRVHCHLVTTTEKMVRGTGRTISIHTSTNDSTNTHVSTHTHGSSSAVQCTVLVVVASFSTYRRSIGHAQRLFPTDVSFHIVWAERAISHIVRSACRLPGYYYQYSPSIP